VVSESFKGPFSADEGGQCVCVCVCVRDINTSEAEGAFDVRTTQPVFDV